MIDDVVRIAVEAGELLRAARREGGLEVEVKRGHGPVTRADREADDHLRRALGALEPAAGWLSEESEDDPARLHRRRVWIVDPLDGTKEFIAGRPEYAVSIALVEGGRPVLAVVRNPERDDTLHAVRGEGTLRNGEPVRVREGRTLAASRTELSRGEFEPFRREWILRPCGSTAYKLALVAAGEGAGTLSRGPKHEWDVCGGVLLVEEAGGVVTDGAGRPCRFNRPRPRIMGIVAGAPDAHARLLSRLREVGMARRR